MQQYAKQRVFQESILREETEHRLRGMVTLFLCLQPGDAMK